MLLNILKENKQNKTNVASYYVKENKQNKTNVA